MPRGNRQNLIPTNQRTKEEVIKNSRKGGIKSGQVRREKKLIRELVSEYLIKDLTEAQKKKLAKKFPTLSEDVTLASAMVAGQVESAMKGNTKAFEVLSEMQEKATAKGVSQSYTIPITDITIDFVEAYREIHEAFDNGKWRTFVFKGGRGSIKSNFVAAIVEEMIYQDPEAHAVFTRRYKTDLRGSVFNQFKKTVIRHGKQDEWSFTTSPLEATYKKTGQKVLFIGCDKPISVKSYNLPFGYVKALINEECDEMAGLEQMDNVEDTFLRNDTNAINIKVFNPPKSKLNFMNQFVEDPPDKTYICHSFYNHVPVKWLGQRFFDRAEWFKINKPQYYANNYMGEVVGLGSEVFDNVEECTITEEMINSWDTIDRGIDWGWYPDPYHFSECYYDKKERVLYIFSEERGNKTSNEVFWNIIQEKYNLTSTDLIIADSAEKKSIADFKSYGAFIRPCKKGQGSIHEGIKWMQSLKAIRIDKQRCPETYKEFTQYEYDKDKDGNPITAYIDADNHSIDSIRYATQKHSSRVEY